MMPTFWIPPFNPFSFLGSGAAKIVAEGWTSLMVALWNAGLWVLKLTLTLSDYFTLPDLAAEGPAAQAYAVMTWIGLSLLLILAMVQLGISVLRRDGKSLAQVLIGVGQYVVVWSCYISLAVAILVAVKGITKALMNSMLHIDAWAHWDPVGVVIPEDLSDGTLATVLGVMGLFLWVAGVGHFLIMLARGVALIVLAVTAPVSAAGLSTGFGRSWFWKGVRWFLAAAFTPIVVVMVLGTGVMLTGGILWEDMTDFQAVLGTAFPSVILICVSCFSPLVLFKLLAFVDPGTSSGAAMRVGLAASGGVQGVLGGKAEGGTSSAASTTDAAGRSQAEKSAASDTSERASQGLGSLVGAAGAALGPVGAAVGTGLGLGLSAMTKAGTAGAVVGADLTNQMGVGHGTYIPEVGHARRGFVDDPDGGAPAGGEANNAGAPPEGDDDDGRPVGPRRDNTIPRPPPISPPAQATPTGPVPPAGAAGTGGPGGGSPTPPAPGGSGAAATGAGAGTAGAGAGTAAAVPPVV
ncbi:hypothetical protein [Ornithinimicrobium murale]|uniref:hypothetical protein n=1 Tax=Ornithinimicrobium murale TaxID=1050153 RepID=UPI000E0D08C9|nr:hypothetical protein [Ornithinimicrobium murale]